MFCNFFPVYYKYKENLLDYYTYPENIICKKHNIDWRVPIDQKIKTIINAGISFTDILINDIHKDGIKVTEKKQFINDFCDNELKISPSLRGATIEEKIANLIRVC